MEFEQDYIMRMIKSIVSFFINKVQPDMLTTVTLHHTETMLQK